MIAGEVHAYRSPPQSPASAPPKVRRVLALLVVRANQIVNPDAVIEELWGQTPPRSAMTTLQTYIYHLRRMFAEEGLDSAGKELLITRHPGYVLRIPQNTLDSEIFERLISDGQDHLERGLFGRAAAVLREALALWNGPPLANVSRGSALEAHVVWLEERRMSALQLRIQADLELGRHHEIIGELRSLTETYPLNEWFSSRLITAFACAGRRSEALKTYHRVRTLLQSELGLDPSPDLQRVLRDVLSSTIPEQVGTARHRPRPAVDQGHRCPVAPRHGAGLSRPLTPRKADARSVGAPPPPP
ncbi:AfsR/SARP family transcriptional regulator [Streptomyces sp. URMC 129]|uniref:AfsR/SARP family transcriptional regulator n=1 Tax=Streptomyces sp. URMC 129 TaxID=3423407 RepID=UPI003F1AAE01